MNETKELPRIAIDTETTGLNPRKNYPFLLSWCTEDGETGAGPLDAEEFISYEALQVVAHSTAIPTFFNAKFDIQMLMAAKFPRITKFDDVMLMAHVLNETEKAYSLEHLARKYLKEEKYENKEFDAWLKTAKRSGEVEANGYLNAPREALIDYAKSDAKLTMMLHQVFIGQLKAQGLMDVYQMELDTCNQLITMEQQGIRVDHDFALDAWELSLGQERFHESELFQMGINNPRSTKQIKDAFKGCENLIVASTKKEVIASLVEGSPVARAVTEYRKVHHRNNTFFKPLLTRCDKNGRVYPSFKQHAAITRRIQTLEPNLSNVERPDEAVVESSTARQCFIPTEGWSFYGADYDQEEMRIVAMLSKEPKLIQAYLDGRDVYRMVGEDIFGSTDITGQQRYIAKQTSLGKAYGMGDETTIKQAAKYGVTLSPSDANRIGAQFNRRFPAVLQTLIDYRNQITSQGYVTDLFGTRYHLEHRHLAYKAFNNVVQGTGAGIIRRVMISLQTYIHVHKLDMRILLPIHDELLVEAKNAINYEWVTECIIWHMENLTRDWVVPITASKKTYGRSWGTAA